MIYGIVGKPGGGKSYESVVYHIIPALKSGRKVITNLPLNIDELVKFYGIDPDLVEIRTKSKGKLHIKANGIRMQSLDYSKPFTTLECYSDDWRSENGQGALFVIDECHLVLPKGRTTLDISQWFSMHRHEGFDLMLITQNFRKVDADICDMIELVFYVSKNTMLGQPSSYTKKVKDGLRGDTVNTEQREYEKKYFRFYQSHTKSNTAITEASVNDVKSLYTKWRRLSSIFLVIGVLVLIYAFSLSFGDDDKPEITSAPSPLPVEKVSSNVVKSKSEKEKENYLRLKKAFAESPQSDHVQVASEPPLEKKVSSSHPFSKIDFHVSGSFTMNGVSSIIFTISQNGQKIGNLLLKDLYLAGYRVSVLNPCLVEYWYNDTFHDYITCDSPRVAVAEPI